MFNEMEVRKACILFIRKLFIYTRDYKFKLFLSGDYEFLSRIYGLSGASGKNIIYISYMYDVAHSNLYMFL